MDMHARLFHFFQTCNYEHFHYHYPAAVRLVSHATEKKMVTEPATKVRKPMEQQQSGVTSNDTGREEDEEALVALLEHRSRKVENLRYYVAYYTSLLKEAEERLQDSESKLARLRGKTKTNGSLLFAGTKTVTTEDGSNSFNHKNETCSKINHQSKPQLPIHAATSPSKISNYILSPGSCSSNSQAKRKFEQKEHKELIPLIGKSSSAESLNYQKSTRISSQHKRKLRSLALSPVNDKLFVTSALDGVINLWEVNSRGSGATLHSTTFCASPLQKRWPEEIAWHPEGKSLFSVYSADSQDSQISVTHFKEGSGHVSFLEDKPHVKGVINSIVFLPWENNTSFVTGGTDHAVILWSESGEKKWKPEPLHRDLHTSAVMGVAGLQQKEIVLSAGKDKRILGYNARVEKQDFMHQVDSKCLSILPNPRDFNLFMVQTGTYERQLRLFDIRMEQKELHAFGWKQESSETQSALVNQDWSPDGLYITSGSADPVIHIFDIRYNGNKSSLSIKAHQKRVFRAMWLQSIPLLVSIASDLNIGIHKVV